MNNAEKLKFHINVYFIYFQFSNLVVAKNALDATNLFTPMKRSSLPEDHGINVAASHAKIATNL